MPSYKVIAVGFMNGCLHSPTRRNVVTTAEPLKKVPKWLELIDDKKPVKQVAKRAAKKPLGKKSAPDFTATTNNGSAGVETL